MAKRKDGRASTREDIAHGVETERRERLMWLVDQWEGWGKTGIPLALAAITAALYGLDVLAELTTALLTGIAFVVLAAVLLVAVGLRANTEGVGRKLFVAAALLGLVGALVPFVQELFPGDSIADVTLRAGDTNPKDLPIPEGSGRYVLRVTPDRVDKGTGQGTYTFVVKQGESTIPFDGEFKVSLDTVRVGRKGQGVARHAAVVRAFDAVTLSGVQKPTIALEKSTGLSSQQGEGIKVQVIPHLIPTWLYLTLALIGLLIAMYLDARVIPSASSFTASMPATALASFSWWVVGKVELDTAVAKTFWFVVFASLGGAAAGMAFTWIARKLFGLKPPAKAKADVN